MKKFLLLLLLSAMACTSSQKTAASLDNEASTSENPTVNPGLYAKTITEEDLKKHLYIYASDDFEGRETGQPGQKKAAEYLKDQYVKMNIPAARSNGDYFQKVPLEVSQLPIGTITIENKDFMLGSDFITFSKALGNYSNVVYAGFGIEDTKYSDYENIDVKDKIILIKAGEPLDANGNYVISGSAQKSVWSNMSESMGKRMEIAVSKGAKGMFYFDPVNYQRIKGRFEWMKNNQSGQMELAEDANTDFYTFLIEEKMAKALYSQILNNDTAQNLLVDFSLKIESQNKKISSENVAAIIKGSEKPDEYLVISSHLDHVGVNSNGEINNGADDDGSGTVALLEIAQAFKKAADEGNGPKRSVVFLHVTGEENGLLGSRFYTDVDPIFPLEQTVANLNIDMIGRIDPKREGNRNYIYLIGSDKLSTELHDVSEMVNERFTKVELDYTYNDENDPNRFYYRSDHYNFAKNNIPIIFYFNGTHEDYHRPSDTADKINYDLLKNRTQLVFHTAWEVVNRDQRIVVDKLVEP